MPSGEDSAFSIKDYDDSYAPGMEWHWWTRARASVVRRAIDQFPRLPILDVGCGPGLTVSYLRSLGYDCTGCEVGRPAVRPEVRDVVVTDRDAVNLDPLRREQIGIILLLDVLEHIADPSAFLQGLRDAFPNLRGVIVTVPARQELWSAWDVRYGHFRRYDRPSVRTLLASTGFDVRSVRYFFHFLYPIMWLAIRAFGRKTVEEPPSAESWFHRLLGLTFAIEARLPLQGLAGTSILATAYVTRSQSRAI